VANSFKIGDVIVLKSGGPPMTVDAVPGQPYGEGSSGKFSEYRCKWFKGATAQQGMFAEHLLTTYTPPAKK
jgi:uncharacterized protein YodC (DUF2158 family)